MSHYSYIFVVMIISSFEMGHCEEYVPLELYYDSISRGLGMVSIVIPHLIESKDYAWKTHDTFRCYEPIYAQWCLEKNVAKKYFKKLGREGGLKAIVWSKVGRDLTKLKETLGKKWDETRLHYDVMDAALHAISRDRPSSLMVFKESADGQGSHNTLGILEQNGQQRPYAYRFYGGFHTDYLPTAFHWSLDLWNQVYPKRPAIVHSYSLGFDRSSHLGDMDVGSSTKNLRDVFLPLSTKYLSYRNLFSLVEPHPSDAYFMGAILRYEPKYPKWRIKVIVKGVIEVLSECHEHGIVHNHDILGSVLVPTEVLLRKIQLDTEISFICDLELIQFDHSFTIGNNGEDSEGDEDAKDDRDDRDNKEDKHNKSSYSSLKRNDHYKPPHPPPEEVDPSLKSSDLRLMDSWYVGLLLLSLHLGCPFLPPVPHEKQIDKVHLDGLYLILFGSTSMDRASIIDKLKKLGYDERKRKVGIPNAWYKFTESPSEPFDLSAFLKKNLDANVVDLALKLMKYDPNGRFTLPDALKHDYFKDEGSGRK